MYVLQREDGKFYWKNQSTSSSHGWEDGFDKAFLFSSRRGAESRMFVSHDMKCEVKEVTVTLEEPCWQFDCKHQGRLVNQGMTFCFADGDVSFPNCSESCPKYEKVNYAEPTYTTYTVGDALVVDMSGNIDKMKLIDLNETKK